MLLQIEIDQSFSFYDIHIGKHKRVIHQSAIGTDEILINDTSVVIDI